MLYEAIYPERDRVALEEYLKAHIPVQVLVTENIDNLFYLNLPFI